MRFTVLDAWRGIAALMVALYRLDAEGALFGLPFVRNAFLFVDFFFVLSGFVIAHAYLDRLTNRPAMLSFMIRRIGRLWPLHAVMTLAFVCYEAARLAADPSATPVPFTGARAPMTILADLALIHGLGFFEYTNWNHVSWSISTELWTYVLFALVCVLARRALAPVALISIGVCLAVLAFRSPTFINNSFHFGLLRCIAGFFTGVLVHLAWRHWRDRPGGPLGTKRWLEFGAATFAFAFVSLAGEGPLSLAAPLVFGLVVFVFAFERGALSRVMQGPAFHLLGELSYSIYMVALLIAVLLNRASLALIGRLGNGSSHVVMLEGDNHTLYAFNMPGATDAFALFYLGIVLFVSVLTFRLIETPGRRAFNTLAERIASKERTSG